MTAVRSLSTAADRNLGIQWVAAVVAGWIIGFFLCGVIEDFISTFFIDGLVIGTAIGIAQALVVRKRIAPAIPWVVVSIIGFGAGKFLADTVEQAMSGLVAMALGGVIIGLLVGITQAVVLLDRFSRAWWWIAANTVGWAVGWSVIGLASGSVDSIAMAYVVGSLGAAVVGVITAVVLIWLTRHPTPDPLPADQVTT